MQVLVLVGDGDVAAVRDVAHGAFELDRRVVDLEVVV